MKILIILTGALGDVARGLPLAAELKKLYPDSEITWLVYPVWSPVVKLNKYIDHVIEFKKGIRGFFQIITSLRKYKFDLVLDLQRNMRSGIFSFSTFGKKRLGFNSKNTREPNSLFNTDQIGYFPETESKVLHYLEFIRYLGGNPGILDFGIVQEKLPARMLEQEYMVFVLGSSWESKNWFLEHYQELAKLCKDHKVVLIGGKGERMNAENIVSENVINLVGKTSLQEMVSIINYSKIVISPDSGPAHIAGALNVPVITLLGATASKRVYPWGSEEYVLYENIPCLGCYKRKCYRQDRLCMQLIKPERVFSLVEKVLYEK